MRRVGRGTVPGDCRRLYNREFPALYCSPNIIRMITSIGVRWVGHVARMGESRGLKWAVVRKLEERKLLGMHWPGGGKIMLTHSLPAI